MDERDRVFSFGGFPSELLFTVKENGEFRLLIRVRLVEAQEIPQSVQDESLLFLLPFMPEFVDVETEERVFAVLRLQKYRFGEDVRGAFPEKIFYLHWESDPRDIVQPLALSGAAVAFGEVLEVGGIHVGSLRGGGRKLVCEGGDFFGGQDAIVESHVCKFSRPVYVC